MNSEHLRRGGEFLAIVVIVVIFVSCFAVFGSGSHFGSVSHKAPTPATTQLAEAVVATGLDAEVSDDVLRQIVQAVMKRAAEGDVEAAAFVFELAARQQAETPPPNEELSQPAS